MNLFNHIRTEIIAILEKLQNEGKLPSEVDFSSVAVMPPREAAHGDMATNAAMVLANKAGIKPRDLAEILLTEIKQIENVESAEIAGAGFINLKFTPEFWQKVIQTIIKEGNSYGNSKIGGDTKINVEFVSKA